MKRFYKIIRALAVFLCVVGILVPCAIYVVLSTPWASEKLRQIGASELSTLLGTQVTIEEISIQPFNRVRVEGIVVRDDNDYEALKVDALDARFEFWNFLRSGRIEFDYVLLDGIQMHVYRESSGSPLNIAGILERLKSEDKDRGPTHFDLAIETVRLENTSLKYDVLDSPELKNGFDINHLSVSGLNLTASAPKVSDEEVAVRLSEFGFYASPGLTVSDITSQVVYTPKSLKIEDFTLVLPQSRLLFGDYLWEYERPADLAQIFRNMPIEVVLKDDSYLTLSDLKGIVP